MYSPLHVVTFIRDMLRQMYFEYANDSFRWHPDPRVSKITIGTVSDVNSNERVQQFPRILIQRGPTACSTQFIGGNLNRRVGGGLPEGGQDEFRQDIQGSINLIIEARHEGTCEEVGEFTRKFLAWSKPKIESMFGFQAFGKQFSISSCDMDREDTEKFKISINIPYIVEDHWKMTGDLMKLNHIFNTLTQIPQTSYLDDETNK